MRWSFLSLTHVRVGVSGPDHVCRDRRLPSDRSVAWRVLPASPESQTVHDETHLPTSRREKKGTRLVGTDLSLEGPEIARTTPARTLVYRNWPGALRHAVRNQGTRGLSWDGHAPSRTSSHRGRRQGWTQRQQQSLTSGGLSTPKSQNRCGIKQKAERQSRAASSATTPETERPTGAWEEGRRQKTTEGRRPPGRAADAAARELCLRPLRRQASPPRERRRAGPGGGSPRPA